MAALAVVLAGQVRAEALHDAVRAGEVAKIERLLAAGARVEARDDKGRTALHYAASLDAVSAIGVLLASGANVEARALGGVTALHIAAVRGAVGATEALLAGGASIESRGEGGWTVLHVAAAHGHVGVIRALVAAGSRIEARDESGWTALHSAMAAGEVEAERWLHLTAKQGNAAAQFNIGMMYTVGEGVPKDDTEAMRWFRLAAKQGWSCPDLVDTLRLCRGGVHNGKDSFTVRAGVPATDGRTGRYGSLGRGAVPRVWLLGSDDPQLGTSGGA